MGVLRTSLWIALAGHSVLSAMPATAAPEDDLRRFAICTGRLSATMEQQWLVSDPASDQTRGQRDAMWSLVEALMPAGSESRVMAWRIEAKVAQAVLLTQARFGTDARAAGHAGARAEALMRSCTSALLG